MKLKCKSCDVEITVDDKLKVTEGIIKALQYPIGRNSEYLPALLIKKLDGTYEAYCKKHYRQVSKLREINPADIKKINRK